MILIENIYMNPEDGTRFRQDNSNTLLPSLSISDSSGGSGSREADLKNMFVRLYVPIFNLTMCVFFYILWKTQPIANFVHCVRFRLGYMNYMFDIQ